MTESLVSIRTGVTFYAGVFEDLRTGEVWQTAWTLNRFNVDHEARNMGPRHVPRLILRCRLNRKENDRE